MYVVKIWLLAPAPHHSPNVDQLREWIESAANASRVKLEHLYLRPGSLGVELVLFMSATDQAHAERDATEVLSAVVRSHVDLTGSTFVP